MVKLKSLIRQGCCTSGEKMVEDSKGQLMKKTPINLDDKISEFLNWYTENVLIGSNDADIRERINEMRGFIEKMAVWYELRYPDYEINRLMPSSGQEEIDVDDIMFNSNRYINDQLDEDSEIRVLDWAEFYNTKAFIRSLPMKERCFLMRPKYQSIVYFNDGLHFAHLHLTSRGFVEDVDNFSYFFLSEINDSDLIGMHIEEVVQLLKEKGITLPENNALENAINNVKLRTYRKEEILNCVMYRIIERGGLRIGPRRALLFAKEFGRNIDIPMMYGVDYIYDGLRIFINEYLKAGGSKDLECYSRYFSRTSKHEQCGTISVERLLQLTANWSAYTPEETELHQRLVDTLARQTAELYQGLVDNLASHIDLDELAKAKNIQADELTKATRIQRKLVRSRKR